MVPHDAFSHGFGQVSNKSGVPFLSRVPFPRVLVGGLFFGRLRDSVPCSAGKVASCVVRFMGKRVDRDVFQAKVDFPKFSASNFAAPAVEFGSLLIYNAPKGKGFAGL